KNASLAFSRLSIIDLSERSNQPLYDAQNQVYILFNGEIYNYLELKQELSRDFEFTTSSDTEVFLKSYIKWGTDCFNKVNGMFA
ncbi:MAG TPA: asparagine synthetase B, partial [Xanthomarina gelatinilytica]|nr:asparagine synthetase B [Xanthomarina gelatinilytica]